MKYHVALLYFDIIFYLFFSFFMIMVTYDEILCILCMYFMASTSDLGFVKKSQNLVEGCTKVSLNSLSK